MQSLFGSSCLLAILLILCSTVIALDTTEAFDPGFSDLEIYVSRTGLGERSDVSTLAIEGLAGVGLTGRFGVFFSYTVESNCRLDASEDCFSLGLLWTPLESENACLDIYCSTGTGSVLSLGTEFNIPAGPVGLQVNAAETWEYDQDDIRACTCIQPLVHFMVSDGTEILASVDLEYHPQALPDQEEFEMTTVSLGLNHSVSESIELIGEVDYLGPDTDDSSFGIVLGMVAGIN